MIRTLCPLPAAVIRLAIERVAELRLAGAPLLSRSPPPRVAVPRIARDELAAGAADASGRTEEEDRAADAALSSATFAVLRRLTCPFVIPIPQSSVWQSSVWQSSVWQSSVWQSSVWDQSSVWCARSLWHSLTTSAAPARCVPLIARDVG